MVYLILIGLSCAIVSALVVWARKSGYDKRENEEREKSIKNAQQASKIKEAVHNMSSGDINEQLRKHPRQQR